jgi:hypothetical protein
MRSKIKNIRSKARFVLENLPESTDIDAKEIKLYMSKIIDITDECLVMLNDVENGLVEISRKIKGAL